MASKYITIPDAMKDTILDTIGDAADAAATAGEIAIFNVSDLELGVLTLADPAFGASDAGIKTLEDIPAEAPADETGTASYYIVRDGDGTECFRGSCGLVGSGESCEMNTLNFVEGIDFDITSLTLTLE